MFIVSVKLFNLIEFRLLENVFPSENFLKNHSFKTFLNIMFAIRSYIVSFYGRVAKLYIQKFTDIEKNFCEFFPEKLL